MRYEYHDILHGLVKTNWFYSNIWRGREKHYALIYEDFVFNSNYDWHLTERLEPEHDLAI